MSATLCKIFTKQEDLNSLATTNKLDNVHFDKFIQRQTQETVNMTRRKAMESKPNATELKSPSTKKVLNSGVHEIRNLLAEQEKMHIPNPDHQIQIRRFQPLPDIVQDDVKNSSESELYSDSLLIENSSGKLRHRSVDETGSWLHKPLRGTLDHNPSIYDNFARRQSNLKKLPPLDSEFHKRRSSCPIPPSNSLKLNEKTPPHSPKSDQGRYHWKRERSETFSTETFLDDGAGNLHIR